MAGPSVPSRELLYRGSPSEFVAALRHEAKAHVAVRHEYLERFAAGDFPSMAFAVRDYAQQYAVYSAGFTSYLQGVIHSLPQRSHRDVLTENLQEEQGLTGVDGHHTPHAVLFDRFRRATGVSTTDEAQFVPTTTVSVWRDLFLQKCQSRQLGVGLGAIGLATELLVSDIYRYILQGIREHTTIPEEHHVFFSLHIDCDDEHAQDLIAITEELSVNPSVREAVRFGVFSSLNLRVAFWDVMLARAQIGEDATHGH